MNPWMTIMVVWIGTRQEVMATTPREIQEMAFSLKELRQPCGNIHLVLVNTVSIDNVLAFIAACLTCTYSGYQN